MQGILPPMKLITYTQGARPRPGLVVGENLVLDLLAADPSLLPNWHGLLPRLNILLELQHTEAIKRAVEAGLGIGCLSRITLRDAFQRGSLVALDMPHRDLRRHFYFVLHRRKFISPGMERWLELCRASANDAPT